MHLRLSLQSMNEAGINDHAQDVMKMLGITYQRSTPQTSGDQWWFWNCKGMPNPLPCYLTDLELDPMDCIGWGLTQEDAEQITLTSDHTYNRKNLTCQ